MLPINHVHTHSYTRRQLLQIAGTCPLPYSTHSTPEERKAHACPADCSVAPRYFAQVPRPNPVECPNPIFGDCLIWRGPLSAEGHGRATNRQAHRVAWQYGIQGAPQTARRESLPRQINHICHRPYCIQPSHLYAGDQIQNTADTQRRRASISGIDFAPWSDAAELLQRAKDAAIYCYPPSNKPFQLEMRY